MEDLKLWEDIDFIKNLEDEYNKIETLFKKAINTRKKQNKKLSKIKKQGFNIVIYSDKKVGFINFKKTKGDNFYSLILFKNGGFEINPDNPLSEEDYKKLTEILELN